MDICPKSSLPENFCWNYQVRVVHIFRILDVKKLKFRVVSVHGGRENLPSLGSRSEENSQEMMRVF